MLIILLFISLASLVMGALNTKKVFFVPALAPSMLNITTIVMVVAFAPMAEKPILVAAIAIALGGFVQFAFQLPVFYRNGYSLGLDAGFRHPGLKKMAMLIIPATLALAVNQINIIVSNILASYLQEGSITYLYYSMRLIQFPIGIFGVAMGMAVLPALSEHAARGDFDRLREDFSFALRLLFFIAVPSMAGLIALREPIVNILFQRGQFDYTATRGTADALLAVPAVKAAIHVASSDGLQNPSEVVFVALRTAFLLAPTQSTRDVVEFVATLPAGTTVSARGTEPVVAEMITGARDEVIRA